MAEFLLEFYVSRSDAAAVRHGSERARRAADELAGEGTRVRYVRSIFVPEDETCFLLYQAESIDAVRQAAGRAGLGNARILAVGRDDVIEPVGRAGPVGSRRTRHRATRGRFKKTHYSDNTI